MSDDGSSFVPSYKCDPFGLLCQRFGQYVPGRLQTLLERVTFEHPPFPMQVEAAYQPAPPPRGKSPSPSPFQRPMVGYLTIHFTVTDRDTGRASPLSFVESGEWDQVDVDRGRFGREKPSDGELLQSVRRAVHVLVMHEADEAFAFAGVRIFDPHEPDACDKAPGRIKTGLLAKPRGPVYELRGNFFGRDR